MGENCKDTLIEAKISSDK